MRWMKQYFPEVFWFVAPTQLYPTVTFSFRQKFAEMYDREVLETRIWRMEQKFPIRPVQPKNVVHLESWTFFSETFSVGQNCSIQFRTEIFRNCGWMECALSLSAPPTLYTILFKIRLLIWGFSTASCSNPGAPIHGRKRGNEFKHKAWVEFVCDANYQLDGNQWSQCVGGVWSHPVPKCIGKLKIIIRLIRKWFSSSFYSSLGVREDL